MQDVTIRNPISLIDAEAQYHIIEWTKARVMINLLGLVTFQAP